MGTVTPPTITPADVGYLSSSLDRILETTSDLELPGLAEPIKVRPLPFVTLTRVLLLLFNVTRPDRVDAKETVIDAIKNIDFRNKKVTPEEVQAVFDLITPVIFRLGVSAPDILERVILDVVIGARKEHIEKMPVNMACAILAYAFDSIDRAVLVSQIQKIFSVGTETLRHLVPQKMNTPKQETSES